MRNFDLKHIAFHALIGLYFIWLCVFSVLLYMSLSELFGRNTPQLSKIYSIWISLNIIMGTSLFLVIRLFRNPGLIGRVVKFTYFFAVLAAIIAICL
jgi:hypothetical protein